MMDPDYRWLIIDSICLKVHKAGMEAKGGDNAIKPDKKKGGAKVYMAVEAHGMPVRIIVTQAFSSDCIQGDELITDIQPEYLLADRPTTQIIS